MSDGAFGIGSISLDIFILLSGFLLFESYNYKQNFFQFWKARFLRILPPYYISLALIIITGYYLSGLTFYQYFADPIFVKFLGNFSLFHQHYFLPHLFLSTRHSLHSVDGSIWSLPYEFLLYSFIPLYFITEKKQINTYCLILILIGALFLNHKNLVVLPLIDLNVLIHLVIPFSIGILLAKYFEKRFLIYILWTCLVLSLIQSQGKSYEFVFIIESIVIFYFFWFLKKMKHISTKGIPDVSYGIFLYGFFIQQIFIDLDFTSESAFNLYILWSGLSTLAIALLSWYIIERPFLRIKNKLN